MDTQGKGMTRAELAEFVSGQIKGFIGTELATIVRQNIEEAVVPLRERVTSWGEKLAGAGRTPPEPVKREQGIALARCVRATAAAKFQGSGPDGAVAILRAWGDHDLADQWADARQKALAAGDATAGGFLVPEQFSTDFIQFLRAAAVMRKLGVPTIPMPTGTVNLGKGTAGATANYIGENTNAPKSQLSTGRLALTFKKLACLTPVSNDLLRYASPGADTIVRNDLVTAMSVKEDSAFIRGNGVDGSPRGLYYWAPGANKILANATVSLQATAADLGKLMQQLMGADIPMLKPCWIFAPRIKNFLVTLQTSTGAFVFKDEMAGGTLWGYPYEITTGVPTNLDATGAATKDESEVYFFDAAQAIIGEAQNIMVDASQEAAYNDGSAIQAAFSLDKTVVRAIAEHDFAMRYEGAVAVLTGVDWAPGSV